MGLSKIVTAILLSLLWLSPSVSASVAEQAGEWPATVADEPAPSRTGIFSSFKRFLEGSDSQPDLLPPEEAFSATVRVRDAGSLAVAFKPVEGYYLYRDRISFTIEEPADINIAGVLLPDGKMKADPTFGHVAVFYSPFEAIVNLKRAHPASSNGRLRFTYQGCSEQGVCYPPIEKTFDFALPAVAVASADASPASTPGGSANPSGAGSVTAISDPDAPAAPRNWLDWNNSNALFEGGSFAWVIAGFFGFGLLLSLTPCVWPMFPILSGIIAGQGPSIGRPRAFWLSAWYVLGLAVSYAAIGIAAGLSGSLLSTALQTPGAAAAMAALFVLFALSMFGLYEFQLPAFFQARIASASQRISRRTAASVFGMGTLSAILVGPCIAAPLAGALLYISQTQDVVLGGTALFAMALGKGAPLLAVGTSLGTLLPRSGPWMTSIKALLGVLLLAAAVWTVSPFLPLPVSMALAGAILIAYAVHLRALDALPADATGMARVGKGLGVIGLLVGAIHLVGALSGSRDFLQPLAGFSGSGQREAAPPLPFERVKSVQELDARLQQAAGRYVMLDFYADWCVSCKEMEHFTLSDPGVKARLQNVLLLQADVTKNAAEDKQLLARFGLFGPPGILFFDRDGQEAKGQRVIGFMDARRFTGVLDQVFP